MADITRGITLSSNEVVTAAKMHQGIESATVTDVARSDMASGSTSVFISSAAPTANPAPVAGHMWFDTTNLVLRYYDGTKWKAVARADTFTNRSGVTLAVGDVVVIDTGNANSVTRTTTAGSTGVFGVVLVGGADLADVIVVTDGYCPAVNVTGSTSIGAYLKTSTTAGKAVSESVAGSGSFARAITSSASAVKAIIGGAVSMAAVAGGFVAAVVDHVSFTKSTSTPSGTTVVSHALGKIPSLIVFHGAFSSNPNKTMGVCAIKDASTTKQIFGGTGESDGAGVAFGDYCTGAVSNNTNYMRGQLTAVTDTDFTITWSLVGAVAAPDTLRVAATVFA